MNKKEYSKLESSIFSQLGFGDLLDNNSISAPILYKMAAEKCFIYEIDTPESHAIREGLRHLNKQRLFAEDNKNALFRGTEDWDKMLSSAIAEKVRV